ncbi:DUF3152 domain-containing protein [Streptomyces sp. NPDC051909]|uniref:DUF3152 domain-containing protein n=1 Tax=Streptomyces sp. NPDC051909 TaxID=3154944 RepID=UPI00343EC368
MGRHSRKGPAPAPVADTGQREAARPGPGSGRRRRGEDQQPPAAGPWQGGQTPSPQRPQAAQPYPGGPRPQNAQQPMGAARPQPYPGGPRTQGAPQYPGGPRPQAASRPPQPPRPYGPQGVPVYGAPGRTAAPLFDTPMHGTPRVQGPYDPYDPSAADSFVRGGHPVHEETAPPAAPFVPGPRREAPPRPIVEETEQAATEAESVGDPEARRSGRSGGLGRALTGVAAAAITTVLAVVVAGQVAERESGGGAAQSKAADRPADRAGAENPASRSDDRPTRTPTAAPAPPSYEELMARRFPIDPKLRGPGRFDAVPGFDKAPGKGRKVRYRIDVEQGLGLDGSLFAQAVQKTLNDPRSWAGRGEMTFERISSGDPDFVITLASPGTTGDWCRKSGLDTTVDNVSCDSASTERVMINAFRWAQGSDTFGPAAMHAYRQMLINHEVGHRLGHNHVSCRTPGALAPVMQQQTKSLDIDGVRCRPNPWVHPGS